MHSASFFFFYLFTHHLQWRDYKKVWYGASLGDISILQDTTVQISIQKDKKSIRMFINGHDEYSSYSCKWSSFSPIHTLSLSLSVTHTDTHMRTHTHKGGSMQSLRHWPEKGLRHRLLWRTTAASSWHSNGPGKPFPQKGGWQWGEVSPRSPRDRGKKKKRNKWVRQRRTVISLLQEENCPEKSSVSIWQ